MSNKQITTIYIVRHGESFANVEYEAGIVLPTSYGKYGAPLSKNGHQQAKNIADKLRNVHFDAIFSSNLSRAKETAEIIARGRKIKVETNSTIHERKKGNEFNKLPKQKKQELEKAVELLNEEEKFLYKFFPDGESAQDAVNRFLKFLKEIIPLYEGKTILVVNHGEVMRRFLVYIGWAKFNELPVGTIKNTGYYVLETNGEKFNIKETYLVNKRQITTNEE